MGEELAGTIPPTSTAPPPDPPSAREMAEGQIAAEPFVPQAPSTLDEAGLSSADVEALMLKYLLHTGVASGRSIAEQIRLPFPLVSLQLQEAKLKQLVAYCGSAQMSDYEYELTETGQQRGKRYHERCSYHGAAPVRLDHYFESVRAQSVQATKLRIADLCHAFNDLSLPPSVISQIGQAVNAGRGLFLYGDPGNGKTSIAERVIRAVRQHIWIPRTLTTTGEIIRLYDPSNHTPVDTEEESYMLADTSVDQRWIRIQRPTVIVGGELTLAHLEMTYHPSTGITEAPVQLKSNCGALVVDDFGRQRVSTSELLNRWIVPLEKGYDFLTLPSGRQLQVPFDQILVFATNLEPRHIVDEAFLRRIPYKIEVFDPSEKEFRALFKQLAVEMGFAHDEDAIDYLVQKHYRSPRRPMRYCHARDLLMQVKNLCEFQDRPLELTSKAFDVAVANYFAGL